MTHMFDCPLTTRGGCCTCGRFFEGLREITYDVARMLGEGWYDDEDALCAPESGAGVTPVEFPPPTPERPPTARTAPENGQIRQEHP